MIDIELDRIIGSRSEFKKWVVSSNIYETTHFFFCGNDTHIGQ